MPRDVYIRIPIADIRSTRSVSVLKALWGAVFISAWALTLSVQQQWAMQEPRHVEWTTAIPRFFCVDASNRRTSEKENQARLDYPEREGGRAIAQPETTAE